MAAPTWNPTLNRIDFTVEDQHDAFITVTFHGTFVKRVKTDAIPPSTGPTTPPGSKIISTCPPHNVPPEAPQHFQVALTGYYACVPTFLDHATCPPAIGPAAMTSFGTPTHFFADEADPDLQIYEFEFELPG